MRVSLDFYEISELKLEGKLKEIYDIAKEKDELQKLEDAIHNVVGKDVLSINELKEYVENNYESLCNELGIQVTEEVEAETELEESFTKQLNDIKLLNEELSKLIAESDKI